jgi:hypothetical protein
MPVTRHPARLAASGLLLVAVITGCGAPAASGAVATSAASVPAATSEASARPSETAGTSAIPDATPTPPVVVPSLSADTPLIDVLPAELGGVPTQKVALVGSDLSAIDASAAMVFGSLLNVLGANDADLTAGVAANATSSVIAIRVAGKSAEEIGEAMIAGRALNTTPTREELSLGGKPVTKVTVSTSPLPFYLYGTGDVSFTVAGADETNVAEALSKLP